MIVGRIILAACMAGVILTFFLRSCRVEHERIEANNTSVLNVATSQISSLFYVDHLADWICSSNGILYHF